MKRRTVEEPVKNFSKIGKVDMLESNLSNLEVVLIINEVSIENWPSIYG